MHYGSWQRWRPLPFADHPHRPHAQPCVLAISLSLCFPSVNFFSEDPFGDEENEKLFPTFSQDISADEASSQTRSHDSHGMGEVESAEKPSEVEAGPDTLQDE